MKKIVSLFAVLFLSATFIFSAACGDRAYNNDWEEYDEPFYANQQPLYVDGDYYIFYQDGYYRRVRRNRITYVNPVFIPVITQSDRDTVYRKIPKRSTVPSSRTTAPSIANLRRSDDGSSPRRSTVPSTRSTSSSSTSRRSTVPNTRSSSSSSSQSKSSSSSRSTVPSSRR